MKVLVTGATGFIGNYVISQLLKQQHTVIATSANSQKAAQMPWYAQVTYIPFDFEQWQEGTNYFRFFDSPDCMIHLAWEGLPNYKSSFHVDINLPRHIKLLTSLIRNGLCDITVTGTCFEYGMQEGCLREDMPVFPHNPYAVAKDRLRQQLETLQQQTPFLLKWVRLFYMYGKGQNPNSLLSQLDRAQESHEQVFNMSGGEQGRDYLPVEEVAAYIVTIAEQQRITGVINCCSGKPVTVKQFVESYLQKKQQTIKLNLGFYPYPDYEPMYFWGDNSKLKKIINNE